MLSKRKPSLRRAERRLDELILSSINSSMISGTERYDPTTDGPASLTNSSRSSLISELTSSRSAFLAATCFLRSSASAAWSATASSPDGCPQPSSIATASSSTGIFVSEIIPVPVCITPFCHGELQPNRGKECPIAVRKQPVRGTKKTPANRRFKAFPSDVTGLELL